MIKNVKDLIGTELNYMVALCEGYKWARNMISRMDESYSKETRWPKGAKCLISPSKSVKLHPTEVNWDGWCSSDGTENMAPAAMYDVPSFSTRWEPSGPIIEREWQNISEVSSQWSNRGVVHLDNPSLLVFCMRCFVSSRMGDEVEIPDQLTKEGLLGLL